MNNVPLVNKNDINSINTSLIAIKKQLKQLNEAMGLIDVPDVDLTPFVRKDEVVDVIESGNMNPVTSNAVSQSLSYSTDEVFTGSYWIDGKPIYRKYVDFGTLPNTTTKTKNCNITNLDRIVLFKGFAKQLTSSYLFCLPHFSSTVSLGIETYINEQTITVYCGYNRSDLNGYFIVEYTKTTDTATRSIAETRSIEEPIEEPKEEEKK